jgi:hypothetical protein
MSKREPRPPKPLPDPGLPATYELAMVEMVAGAIERIEHLLSGSAGEWLAQALRERLRRGLTDRQKVIDAAWDGDDLSHEVLMAEFHDILERGEMPPASLRAYAAQRDKHPKRGKGRVWYDGWRRNYGFCLLIALTAERFGLQATRSRASVGPCATSVASLALQRRGFKRVSESRLANLWGQLGDITIESIALQRAWPELGPYVRMSGNPAHADWNAVVGPYQKKLLA